MEPFNKNSQHGAQPVFITRILDNVISDIRTALENMRDTLGIKKIVDPVTVIQGLAGSSAWPIKIRDDYGWEVECTPMDELCSVTPIRLVGATFTGTTLDPNFWTSTVTGSGANTQANNQLSMATNPAGAIADSTCALQSNRIGRYIGGSANRYRAQIQQGTAPTANNIRRWGMFNTTDGAFFELNGTTLNVVTRKTSSDTAVPAASWNGTAFTMDTNIHAYEIYVTNAKVYFVIDGILRHTMSATTTTWSDTIHLPVRAENNNSGGITTNIVMNIRVATIYRLGELQTESKHSYLTGAATTVLKYGPGKLHTVTLNTTGGTSLTLYDNTAGSGTIIVAPNLGAIMSFDLDIPFYTGLTAVTVGAAAAVTVSYE